MRSKYNAKKTYVDGICFDSKAEAKHYEELKLRMRAGEISDLTVHPRFPLEVNGERICVYEADFQYIDVKRGTLVTSDVKGVKTALYKLKKKLMLVCLGIEVEEVHA